MTGATQRKKNQLAAFLTKARTTYRMTEMSASGEIYTFSPITSFHTIIAELLRQKIQCFELWILNIGYHPVSVLCKRSKISFSKRIFLDTAGDFAFSWKEFKKIDSLAAANGLISVEYYLGWPNRGQMQQVAGRADRILLHAYRPNDGMFINIPENRSDRCSFTFYTDEDHPYFSSETSFMGPWLATHPITTTFIRPMQDITHLKQVPGNRILICRICLVHPIQLCHSRLLQRLQQLLPVVPYFILYQVAA